MRLTYVATVLIITIAWTSSSLHKAGAEPSVGSASSCPFSEMVRDIDNYRKNHKKTNWMLEVTPLVHDYIPVGSSADDLQETLRRCGFIVIPHKSDNTRFTASLSRKSLLGFGIFGDVLYIYFESDTKIVRNYTALVIYEHL